MKRLSILFTVASFSMLTMGAYAQDIKPVKNSNQGQPYKIENSNLRFGNSMLSQKVLNAWKDFDNNMMDNSVALFADDIVATFPDGTSVKGRDNFMSSAKTYRSSLAAVSSTIDACTTLKSPDHPEREAVVIWGVETDTMKDGTTQRSALHEVWFFNKEGKVFEFHQYAAKIMDEKK